MEPNLKIISFGRVGTIAIRRFLDEHPQISVPKYEEIAKLFKLENPQINDIPFDHSEQIKVKGMLIHNGEFLTPEYSSHLDRIKGVKTEQLIHLVRNPFEQVLSWINFINECAELGILGWESIDASFKGLLEKYPYHVEGMKSGLHAQYFYDSTQAVKLVDCDQLSTAHVSKTMKQVFEFLGVDSSYHSDSFFQTHNSFTTSLLKKGASFQINGETIQLFLQQPYKSLTDSKNDNPWVTVHDAENVFKNYPSLASIKGDLAVYPVDERKYQALKPETRKILNDNMDKILPQVLSQWAEQAQSVVPKIAEKKIQSLTDEDHDAIKNYFKDDFAILAGYHPEYKSKWDL